MSIADEQTQCPLQEVTAALEKAEKARAVLQSEKDALSAEKTELMSKLAEADEARNAATANVEKLEKTQKDLQKQVQVVYFCN